MEIDGNLEKELQKFSEPAQIIGNPRHFDHSGDMDTVSTVSTIGDATSISFNETIQVMYVHDKNCDSAKGTQSTQELTDEEKQSTTNKQQLLKSSGKIWQKR